MNESLSNNSDMKTDTSSSLFNLSCSDQPGITVTSTKFPSNYIILDERNDTGMRSLQVDPKSEYLAAVGIDGKLRVHYIANSTLLSLSAYDHSSNLGDIDIIDIEENVLVESIMSRQDGSEESRKQVGQCVWHPMGKCLALAGRSNVILKVNLSHLFSYVFLKL